MVESDKLLLCHDAADKSQLVFKRVQNCAAIRACGSVYRALLKCLFKKLRLMICFPFLYRKKKETKQEK